MKNADLPTKRQTTHASVYGIGAQGRAEGPENGDIVIRSGRRDVEPSYVVHERSGPDQFGCATLAQAIDLARSYARHANVDVWSGDGPTDGFTLMARFRDPGVTRPGLRAFSARAAHAQEVTPVALSQP
jgi:hypothetical protein